VVGCIPVPGVITCNDPTTDELPAPISEIVVVCKPDIASKFQPEITTCAFNFPLSKESAIPIVNLNKLFICILKIFAKVNLETYYFVSQK
jgi:hypothetical protein